MKARELEEGKASGEDMEATTERLGKWYKGINPKAKPGEKGYMRKRNVPPTKDKYNPTKHEAPEKGKPLKYMKPQHKDYTIGNINSRVGVIAARNAERSNTKIGNLHRRFKAQKDRYETEKTKGKAVLKKHGVPNPSVPEMAAKWIKGNNPKSKDNPEGYVRSDKK